MSEAGGGRSLDYESPDGKHVLTLDHAGEVRFGPAYFIARLDGRPIPGRVFGHSCSWSADSRHVALELWNSTLESHGPDTSLFLVRPGNHTCYDRPRVRRGFVRGARFEGSSVVYTKDQSRTVGTIEECELPLTAIQDWSPLFP